MNNEQNMGIKDSKTDVSPPALSPKVAPAAGSVTAPGVLFTAPLVSSECLDLAVLAAILAFLLLAAIVGLCIHIRNSVLGARLMKACGGDFKTAALAIENVKAENGLMHDLLTMGMSITRIAPRDFEVSRMPKDDVQ